MKKMMYQGLRLFEIESDRKWQIHLEEDDIPGLESLFPSLAPALHKGKQVGKVQDDLVFVFIGIYKQVEGVENDVGLKIKVLIHY